MLAETALVSLVLYLLIKVLVATANALQSNWSLLELAEGSFTMLDNKSLQAQRSQQKKSNEEVLKVKGDAMLKRD